MEARSSYRLNAVLGGAPIVPRIAVPIGLPEAVPGGMKPLAPLLPDDGRSGMGTADPVGALERPAWDNARDPRELGRSILVLKH